MTTLVPTVSILPCRNDTSVYASGATTLNLSENPDVGSELYATEKKDYFKTWENCPENPQKIKDSIKELEQLFLNYQCVHLNWKVKNPLFLFFNSGSMVNVSLDEYQTKIKKVVIDNSLCGKLHSEHVTDVIVDENHLFISYSEPKLSYINFDKQSSLFVHKFLRSRKPRIFGNEPQITTVDLLLPTGRRLEKKLSLNCLRDRMLIWWHFSSNDIWPWMPVNQSVDRISLLVYVLNGESIELLCTAKTQGELRYASFSKWHSNSINTLEEITKGGQCDLNICVYEVTSGACQCISLVKLPLHGHLTAFAWNHSEDKLLMSGEDMSLSIYDLNSNITTVTSTNFVVHDISWHPGGNIAAVTSSNSMLQCYDVALNSLKFEASNRSTEPLNMICLLATKAQTLQAAKIKWQDASTKLASVGNTRSEESDTILMYFSSGLLAFFKFTFGCVTKYRISPLELISQYLKNGRIDEAVCLLQSLSWSRHPEMCLQCLSKIANCLLRKPLCRKTETALEHSLGTFYNSFNVLPEAILCDYHQQVDCIARRFFHHLLRFHKLEKAYLLAVELESRDLFLDLHHVAKQMQETPLAVIAYKHAEKLEASNSSVCDESVSDSSEADIDVLEKTNSFLKFGLKNNDIQMYESKQAEEPVDLKEQLIEEKRQTYIKDSNQRCKIFCNKSNRSTSRNVENISGCELSMDSFIDTNEKTVMESASTNLPYCSVENASSLSTPNKFDFNDIVDEDEEEEDVEGVRVKFSHFGIV